jgi:hypothetical protein
MFMSLPLALNPNQATMPQASISRLFKAYTTVSKLLGNLPPDATIHEPPHWQQHEGLWQVLLEAYDRRDFVMMYDAWENSLRLDVWDFDHSDEPQHIPSLPDKTLAVCATEKGRLGVAEGCIDSGDEIWVLHRLYKPVVLHRVGEGRHHMVACVYIHGIMYGEVVSSDDVSTEIDIK